MNKMIYDACGTEIMEGEARVEADITYSRSSKWGYEYRKDFMKNVYRLS